MIKLTCHITDWFAQSVTLKNHQDWTLWAHNEQSLEISHEPLKMQNIPPIQARRMSVPCKLACEVFLSLSTKHSIDAAVFVSQHGELERSYKILSCLAENQDLSPTDFSMSVHNTAGGLATIIAKQTIEVSSISAGADGFHQGVIEAMLYLERGAKRVLLIDFDGEIPSFYEHYGEENFPAYACGFVIEKGSFLHVEQIEQENSYQGISLLPQSLQFLKGLINVAQSIDIPNKYSVWHWKRG